MITINDKEYDPADMTAEQHYMITQVTNCRNKAQIASMDMQIAQVAERQFTAALIASVEESEPPTDELDG